MSLPKLLEQRLRLPLVAAPMFLISNPALVLGCCSNGVEGSFPALNQRNSAGLRQWLEIIEQGLASQQAPEVYKDMLLNARAADIVHTAAVSGVPASFMRQSLENAGVAIDALHGTSTAGLKSIGEEAKA